MGLTNEGGVNKSRRGVWGSEVNECLSGCGV